VLSTHPHAIVLRVPVLYGETSPADNNAESAINILMDSLHKAQKEPIKMDHYAIRYPTNTEDVARVCVDVAKLYTSQTPAASQQQPPRILQFSSEDRMTKYEISQVFGEIMGLPLDKMEADAESGKKPAADGTLRPYDCHLSTKELADLGVDVSTMDFAAWWKRKVGAFRH
jgi:S-adenosylmethionine synthetase